MSDQQQAKGTNGNTATNRKAKERKGNSWIMWATMLFISLSSLYNALKGCTAYSNGKFSLTCPQGIVLYEMFFGDDKSQPHPSKTQDQRSDLPQSQQAPTRAVEDAVGKLVPEVKVAPAIIEGNVEPINELEEISVKDMRLALIHDAEFVQFLSELLQHEANVIQFMSKYKAILKDSEAAAALARSREVLRSLSSYLVRNDIDSYNGVEVIMKALDCLLALSFHDAVRLNLILEESVFDGVIVQLKSEAAALKAAGIIVNLSANAKSLAVLVEKKAFVGIVTETLADEQTSIDVKAAMASIVSNIALLSSQTYLTYHAAVPLNPLINMLDCGNSGQHTKETYTAEIKAASALENLSSMSSVRSSIGDMPDAFEVFLRCFKQSELQTKYHITGVLANLAQSPSNSFRIASSTNAIVGFMTILARQQGNAMDTEIKERVGSILGNIAMVDENIPFILSSIVTVLGDTNFQCDEKSLALSISDSFASLSDQHQQALILTDGFVDAMQSFVSNSDVPCKEGVELASNIKTKLGI